MNKEDFESLQRGLAEAKAFIEGEREGFVVHEPVDVRAVRARTDLKRREFAERYNLDARAVEQWEQGRRRPERGTEMYLRLIGHDPDGVAEMVSQVLREEPAAYRAAKGRVHAQRKKGLVPAAEAGSRSQEGGRRWLTTSTADDPGSFVEEEGVLEKSQACRRGSAIGAP
jgi:putative transcriptional regulator